MTTLHVSPPLYIYITWAAATLFVYSTLWHTTIKVMHGFTTIHYSVLPKPAEGLWYYTIYI